MAVFIFMVIGAIDPTDNPDKIERIYEISPASSAYRSPSTRGDTCRGQGLFYHEMHVHGGHWRPEIVCSVAVAWKMIRVTLRVQDTPLAKVYKKSG
jgi:hypothetical protein